MTAVLADLRELARPLPAFAAFQFHFLSAFAGCPTNRLIIESIRVLRVLQGVALDEFTQHGAR